MICSVFARFIQIFLPNLPGVSDELDKTAQNCYNTRRKTDKTGSMEADMNKAVIYIHGKGGNAAEAEHYKPLFPGFSVLGFDYKSTTPHEAKDEFGEYFGEVRRYCHSVTLIANSIGAYFAMSAPGAPVDRAYFISPIVDMAKLISDMMAWSGVTESELQERKLIETPFGETLSWDYLSCVKANPIVWRIPTHILYGENDNLTSYDTVASFARETGASLDVMPGGEHWFHTPEQMSYLDEWIRRNR